MVLVRKQEKPFASTLKLNLQPLPGKAKTESAIVKQGADALKRNHLELGGKSPVIVFDDADLNHALDAVIFMIYSSNGKRCIPSSRLLL